MARANDGTPDFNLIGLITMTRVWDERTVLRAQQFSSCKSVLDAFHSIDLPLSPNSTSTDLFASWATLFSTHIRFAHTNDCQYLIYAGSIYPQGYGENTTAFSTLVPIATAEFVVENEKVVGFGWDNIGDDGDVKQSGSIEETSEVWFVKQA